MCKDFLNGSDKVMKDISRHPTEFVHIIRAKLHNVKGQQSNRSWPSSLLTPEVIWAEKKEVLQPGQRETPN